MGNGEDGFIRREECGMLRGLFLITQLLAVDQAQRDWGKNRERVRDR